MIKMIAEHKVCHEVGFYAVYCGQAVLAQV